MAVGLYTICYREKVVLCRLDKELLAVAVLLGIGGMYSSLI